MRSASKVLFYVLMKDSDCRMKQFYNEAFRFRKKILTMSTEAFYPLSLSLSPHKIQFYFYDVKMEAKLCSTSNLFLCLFLFCTVSFVSYEMRKIKNISQTVSCEAVYLLS